MHLYAYLKGNPKSKTVFDPTPMEHGPHADHDWRDMYNDYVEAEPHDMPPPRGNPLQMTAYTDSDHASDVQSRRSRTGVLIFVEEGHLNLTTSDPEAELPDSTLR